MRLSKLMHDARESILREFEEFARTHTAPGASMDVKALRDHAAAMLDAFALDLEQPQSEPERERKGKGKGNAFRPDGGALTAAEEHGLARARSGFSLTETFAEYRALRASVMRHWTAAENSWSESQVQDVIRFNEAIDQAIAESIYEYSKAVAEYREMFLAVLGHDLRSPLNAVLNASTFLAENADLSERDARLARAIQASGRRMAELIEDILDFAVSRIGPGLPLDPQPADLGEIAREIVDESRVIHPGRQLRLARSGDLAGRWDERRLRQGMLNLIDNAVQHGAEDSPVTVTASQQGAGDDVVVAVHNLGPAIPPEERAAILEPFRRGSGPAAKAPPRRGHLGLGLYIARRVAEAHGGGLDVDSTPDRGTTFSLRLPRHPPEDG